MSYGNDFTAAIERTERLGLSVPSHRFEHGYAWLDQKALDEFPYVVQRGLQDLEVHDVALQCLAINSRLQPVIENWLNCPVIYTLGWIQYDTGSDLFHFDEAFIENKLKRPDSFPGRVNLHAWLTLPSMEIIDISLSTSMGVAQNRPEMCGAVIASHADEIKGFAFKPMLVGDDFLRKSGAILDLSG